MIAEFVGDVVAQRDRFVVPGGGEIGGEVAGGPRWFAVVLRLIAFRFLNGLFGRSRCIDGALQHLSDFVRCGAALIQVVSFGPTYLK